MAVAKNQAVLTNKGSTSTEYGASTSVTPLLVSPVPLYCSVRLLIYLMTHITCALVSANFQSLNFAWICMTHDRHYHGTKEESNTTMVYDPSAQGPGHIFDWDKDIQRVLFIGYPIGALTSVLLSGWVIDKLGSRVVVVCMMLVVSIANALVPTAAFVSWELVFVLRIVSGLTGMGWPVAYNVLSHWVPKKELGMAMSLILTGFYLGSFVSMWLSGYQCKNSGWKYIFYTMAICFGIYAVIWGVCFRTDPINYPWITEGERALILAKRSKQHKAEHKHVTPWKALFTSSAMWAVTINCFCVRFSTLVLNMFMPQFLNQVLKLDLANNGLLSALPYIASFIGRAMSGPVSDLKLCREKLCSNKTTAIKTWNTMGTLGIAAATGLLAVIVKVNAQPPIPVFLLCLVMFSAGVLTAGYVKSPVMIAPHHGGVIGAINHTAGYIANILVPVIVVSVLSTGHISEWRTVFSICSALTVIACIVFILIGSAQLQSWDKQGPDDCEGEAASASVRDTTSTPTEVTPGQAPRTTPPVPLGR